MAGWHKGRKRIAVLTRNHEPLSHGSVDISGLNRTICRESFRHDRKKRRWVPSGCRGEGRPCVASHVARTFNSLTLPHFSTHRRELARYSYSLAAHAVSLVVLQVCDPGALFCPQSPKLIASGLASFRAPPPYTQRSQRPSPRPWGQRSGQPCPPATIPWFPRSFTNPGGWAPWLAHATGRSPSRRMGG